MPHVRKEHIERDYSHRTLIDKLGVKNDSRVSIVGVDDNEFLAQLRSRTANIIVDKTQKDSDFIFYSADSRTQLRKLKSLKSFLKQNGGIWVVSLKGKLARIRDIDVIEAAKSAGLVDNKVVGFSETHTSLKLVIPLAKRKPL
jgi:hypothetical protein